MIAGVVILAVVALGALLFVLAPLLQPSASRSTRRDAAVGRLRELHARQQMLFASLKDLEDDRATDKLSDEDYEQLKARISGEAVGVMRELDAAEAQREADLEQRRKAAEPLRHPGAGSTDPAP